MNPPATCIDDLPSEMISELFKYLSPKDLVVCSMVNRCWHSIYTSFRLRRLVTIYYTGYNYMAYNISGCIHKYNYSKKWYDSNRSIQETDQCSLAIFACLVEKPLLSNLKYLALCRYSSESYLNELGHWFPQLVHLEIDITLSEGMNVHWNFPKLRVLAIHISYFSGALSIDCPELSTLAYNSTRMDERLLEVKQPETIRKFQTNLLGLNLDPFKGVECLIIQQPRMISKALLISLPRLKEVHFISSIGYVFSFWSGIRTVDQMKRMLSVFLSELKNLGRWSEFKFRFCGFELTKLNVSQIDFGGQFGGSQIVSDEYVYMKNYGLIEPGALDFVRYIDYTALMSYVTGELPRCFLQKLTDVCFVATRGLIQDPDHFLWFLSSLKSLRGLELKQVELSGLSQEFYDQLPVSAYSLAALKLEGDAETLLQLNFDFIEKMLNLSELHIQPSLTFESFTSLVRWSDRLEGVQINVQSEGKCFEIRKIKRCSTWGISALESNRLPKKIFEAENLNQIINFLKLFQIWPF